MLFALALITGTLFPAAQAPQATPVNQTMEFQKSAVDGTRPVNGSGTLTVVNVTRRFAPADGLKDFENPASRRGQFVRVEVKIANSGKVPLTILTPDFYLKSAGGTRIGRTSDLLSRRVPDVLNGTLKLAPGESVEGALYYDIGVDEALDQMRLALAVQVINDKRMMVKRDFEVTLAPAGGR